MAIARTRVLEMAITDFINAEKLSIPSYVPLPTLPPMWIGNVPSLTATVQRLKEKLRVPSVTEKGRLLIPANTVVPCAINDEMKEVLDQMRAQFPDPEETTDGDDYVEEVQPKEDAAEKSSSLQQFMDTMHVVKTISEASVNLLIAESSMEPDGFTLWMHNPSLSLIHI